MAYRETVPQGKPEPLYFDAVLRPNRSLSPRGFALVMLVLAGASFAAGVAFVSMGAWPVVGFFGLDVVLVWWAFRLNYRSGLLSETVRLDGSELTVTREMPGGRFSRWTFEPIWVRVLMDDPPEHESRLRLASHGRELSIGAFLSPRERGELADALRDALRRFRSGLATH